MMDIIRPTGPPDRDALRHAHDTMDDTYLYLSEMAEALVREVKVEWDLLKSDGGDIRKLNKLLSGELTSLLRLAKETEGSLNGRRKDRAGKAAQYAIDVGQARSEIRSRLDRIIATQSAGELPDVPERA